MTVILDPHTTFHELTTNGHGATRMLLSAIFTTDTVVLLRNGNVRTCRSSAASTFARILRAQGAADLWSDSTKTSRPCQERERYLAVGQASVYRSSVSWRLHSFQCDIFWQLLCCCGCALNDWLAYSRILTRKPCCRKETARCRSRSFRFKVRRQHSITTRKSIASKARLQSSKHSLTHWRKSEFNAKWPF